MNLLKVGESGLHKRINRRGIIEQQGLSSAGKKAFTRKTKSRNKRLQHKMFSRKVVKARGISKFR